MEENKRNSKVVVIVIIVVFVIFALIASFVVCRKAIKKNASNDVKVVTELNQEQKKIYDSLITATGTYGFYFDKSVTIDDIEDDKMLRYVLDQYSSSHGIPFVYNFDSNTSDDECNFSKSMTRVKKEEIDDYIKTEFNTSRIFTLKNDEGLNCSIYNGFISGTESYVYTPSDNSYGFGYVSTEGEYNRVYVKFLKAEQGATEYVFYDNALVCKDDGIVMCGTDEGHIGNLFEVAPEEDYDKSLFDYSEEGLDVNADYVFGKYSDKLNTYKHTFKMASDGKYYWYSSELVK